MRFYFVKNDKWYSKALMKMLDEPVSHIGIGLFTDEHDGLDLVIDCTKPHGKLYHMKHWTSPEKYQIVNTLELKLSISDELLAYDRLIDQCVLTPYDWGAYYYAWIVLLGHFLFKTPIPKENKWSTDGMWCSEIIDPIEGILGCNGVDVSHLDFETLSPHMVYQELKKFENIKEL